MEELAALKRKKEMEKTGIENIFSAAELNPETIDSQIRERFRLLGEKTKTLEDNFGAVKIADSLFKYYEENEPKKAFSEDEKSIAKIGTIFTDIGKTGPKKASQEEQSLIAEMFAVENVKDPKMLVSDFFKAYFPADSVQKEKVFAAMGLNPSMTMREFWNLHSVWTLEIISGDGVPPEAVAAAAAHHALEGINPEGIIGADDRFTKYSGDNCCFDRAEKLIILLDKYDAFTRRGKKSHKEAIDEMKKAVGNSLKYKDDVEFKEIIEDLDSVISAEKIKR